MKFLIPFLVCATVGSCMGALDAQNMITEQQKALDQKSECLYFFWETITPDLRAALIHVKKSLSDGTDLGKKVEEAYNGIFNGSPPKRLSDLCNEYASACATAGSTPKGCCSIHLTGKYFDYSQLSIDSRTSSVAIKQNFYQFFKQQGCEQYIVDNKLAVAASVKSILANKDAMLATGFNPVQECTTPRQNTVQ